MVARIWQLPGGRIAVALDTDDLGVVSEVATAWTKANVEWQNRNADQNKKGRFVANMEGALSELCVCRYYGVEPRWTVGGSDGGADVILKNRMGFDRRVAVKSTPYFKSPHLLVQDFLDKPVDAYVLVSVAVDEGYAEIVGWCSHELVASKPCKEFVPGKQPCRAVKSSELRAIPCRECVEVEA